MDSPATIVWLAPEPPDAEQSRSLASWSQARGIQMAPPRPATPPALATDPTAAEVAESMLQRARDSIAAREGDEADRALASAESVLRAHPELLQAAWLMAEVERAKAARLRRLPPVDPEAAEEAWLRAEALDGGRVPGVGEESSSRHPLPATLSLEVSSDQTQLWLDGEFVSSGVVATRAGPHALVVTWDGAPIWAAWIDTPPGYSTVRVPIPEPPACTAGDLARVRIGGSGIDAHNVQCRLWIFATTGDKRGSVRLAECAAARCGAVITWQAPAPWTWSPAVQRDRRTGWPTWGTWSLVAAGAALAAGVVIFATTRPSAPTETRFVNGGLKTP
jgi:hypothetical protein